MESIYIYSLNHNKLVEQKGAKETINIINILNNGELIEEDLISKLFKNNLYDPIIQINNVKNEDKRRNIETINKKCGKDICKDKDENILPTKKLYDTPGWQLKKNDIIIYDESIEIIGSKNNRIYSKSDIISKKCERDFENDKPRTFISFKTFNLKEAFEEAEKLCSNKKFFRKNVKEVLDNSERITRLSITGYLINDALSLKKIKPQKGKIENLIEIFNILPKEYVNEYKDQIGLSIHSANRTLNIKDIFHAIDKVQGLHSIYQRNVENNNEAANKVIEDRIDEILEKTQHYNQNTLINALSNSDKKYKEINYSI